MFGRYGRAACVGLFVADGAGAQRRLDRWAAAERGFCGRHGRRGKAVAMSKKSGPLSDPRANNSSFFAAVRQAARQEQFLEVVSAEEARRRFAACVDHSPL